MHLNLTDVALVPVLGGLAFASSQYDRCGDHQNDDQRDTGHDDSLNSSHVVEGIRVSCLQDVRKGVLVFFVLSTAIGPPPNQDDGPISGSA